LNGKRQTLVQNTATVFNDLIDTDSYTLVEWGDVIPADSVVRYDTLQSLTSNQQLQARANIGAVGLNNFVPFTNKDQELESRITAVESELPSADALAAIAGANAPSATNPFLTASGGSGKADAVHTHVITDIVDLVSALADKADFSHTHLIADVSGLRAELDTIQTKAPAIHTHPISDVLGLPEALDYKADADDLLGKADVNHTHDGLVTVDIKEALEAAPVYQGTADNPFITRQYYYNNYHSVTFFSTTGPLNDGNVTTTTHPLELGLRIGGQIYYMPMRWYGADPFPPITN
jgi:hypothetical protein